MKTILGILFIILICELSYRLILYIGQVIHYLYLKVENIYLKIIIKKLEKELKLKNQLSENYKKYTELVQGDKNKENL